MKPAKLLLFSACAALALLGSGLANDAASLSADQALRKLMAGNLRYATNRTIHPDQSAARRMRLAKGQQPFTVIMSCSDSRAPAEIVFDQGLGDLFVIRVAWNVVDDHAIGSIEYAVEHLGVHLVIVLGHERCGAVTADVSGGEAPGHIASLLDAIKPVLAMVKDSGGDRVDQVVRANALYVAGQLRSSQPILAHAVEHGGLEILAARYDLDSGKVEIVRQADGPGQPLPVRSSASIRPPA